MEYFPKVSSSTKRVPREYMTNTEKHGHSMEIQTLGSSPKPTYSPMPTQTYAPPNKNYDKPIHADRTPAYLESFVPLSSTPKPVKVDESAILLGLTPQVQNKIPDGYELVPLDKLTDEYEIVPWNEVQNVLNVTNLPGLGPQTPIHHNTHHYYPDVRSPPNEIPIIKKKDIEIIKTWYNPPPISPDLPTLYYDGSKWNWYIIDNISIYSITL